MSLYSLLGLTLAACTLSEVLVFVLVYRTDNYKRLRGSFDQAERKLEVPAPSPH